MRQINLSYFEFFTLIGLRGLRGIKSKNCVSTIESVKFYHGINIWIIREPDQIWDWVNPLIGLRGLSRKMVFLQ